MNHHHSQAELKYLNMLQFMCNYSCN